MGFGLRSRISRVAKLRVMHVLVLVVAMRDPKDVLVKRTKEVA